MHEYLTAFVHFISALAQGYDKAQEVYSSNNK